MGLEQCNPLEEKGTLITVQELGSSKTPGIDGITSEFLKVFWGKMNTL